MTCSAKIALAAALAVLALPFGSRPAQAQQSVTCTNCATTWDQLRQVALEVEARAARVRAYVLQGQQYANMVQNTVAIPRFAWVSLQNDVRMVQGLLGQGSHFSLNSGFSLSTLSSYSSYLGQAIDMPGKYRQWSEQANSNASSILRGLGLQQDQLSTDQANLADAQGLVQISEGQVQAIQAHAMLTGQLVAETQKLRQIEMARAQLEVNRQAGDADRQAVEAALLQQFLGAPRPAMTGGQRY